MLFFITFITLFQRSISFTGGHLQRLLVNRGRLQRAAALQNVDAELMGNSSFIGRPPATKSDVLERLMSARLLAQNRLDAARVSVWPLQVEPHAVEDGVHRRRATGLPAS